MMVPDRNGVVASGWKLVRLVLSPDDEENEEEGEEELESDEGGKGKARERKARV